MTGVLIQGAIQADDRVPNRSSLATQHVDDKKHALVNITIINITVHDKTKQKQGELGSRQCPFRLLGSLRTSQRCSPTRRQRRRHLGSQRFRKMTARFSSRSNRRRIRSCNCPQQIACARSFRLERPVAG